MQIPDNELRKELGETSSGPARLSLGSATALLLFVLSLSTGCVTNLVRREMNCRCFHLLALLFYGRLRSGKKFGCFLVTDGQCYYAGIEAFCGDFPEIKFNKYGNIKQIKD